MEEAALAVDVAPLEGEPLLRAQAGAGDDQGEGRAELGGDRLKLDPGSERLDLVTLRLRVLHLPGHVLRDVPARNRVGEHLPEGLDDVPGRAGREPLPPGGELVDHQPVEPLRAEGVPGVPEPGSQGGDRVVLGDVLVEVLVDQHVEREGRGGRPGLGATP